MGRGRARRLSGESPRHVEASPRAPSFVQYFARIVATRDDRWTLLRVHRRYWQRMRESTNDESAAIGGVSSSRVEQFLRSLGLTDSDDVRVDGGTRLGRVSIVHGANADVIWCRDTGAKPSPIATSRPT